MKMKGKNKWLSLFFALAIILTTLLPNALTALNISTDSINESHITAIQIKQKTDGLAPFDADNTAGNDANNANNIVRSFDNVNYTLEYVTELKTNWAKGINANVKRVIVPPTVTHHQYGANFTRKTNVLAPVHLYDNHDSYLGYAQRRKPGGKRIWCRNRRLNRERCT
jgi:hypothetical protein